MPPCGIFCGTCPKYIDNKCRGASHHCKVRKCKGIYVCSKNRGLNFCYECKNFPCSRFKQFAKSWSTLGQDLIENQKLLQKLGESEWLEQFNNQLEK